MEKIPEFLASAMRAAVEAGKTIKAASEKVKSIETKENSQDLVVTAAVLTQTKTDKAVESFLFSQLRKEYPDHIFVGEETASLTGSTLGQLDDRPTWIIDPIDGTTNFVHGFPFSCVSIGLAINKRPAVGVVYNPFLGDLYYAAKGHGSYCARSHSPEDILKVASKRLGQHAAALPPSLAQALIATEYGTSKLPEHLLAKLEILKTLLTAPVLCRGVRSVGSAAMSMCLVASGAIDVYYEAGVHAWDVCAGAVIVAEAGGIVRSWLHSDFDVLDRTAICIRPGHSGSTSPPVLEELLAAFKPISYPRD
ncbi:Inositol monophosphatase 2 [Kappamyces sp. JEL0829]|nr:Inositol monophosphatase 2 [Kappamyces sp. JEL0829]